jgi:hypothetical protein
MAFGHLLTPRLMVSTSSLCRAKTPRCLANGPPDWTPAGHGPQETGDNGDWHTRTCSGRLDAFRFEGSVEDDYRSRPRLDLFVRMQNFWSTGSSNVQQKLLVVQIRRKSPSDLRH